MSETYDAMVVGAGPAGSYLAYRLAKLGYKVLVFERRPKVGDAVCCTGIVGKECLDRFPIANDTPAVQANSATFYAPSGESLSLRKETAQAYVVDRAAFDNALARRAQDEGAEYLMSARVNDLVLFDHRVRADVELGGRTGNFEGKVAVISTGFGASLPGKLGLGKISDFVLGAQAEVDIKGVDEVEIYMGQSIAPGFFAWLVPTTSGRGLAGLLTRRDPPSYLKNFLSKLHEQGKIASTDVECNYGGIPLRPLSRTYRDRVVVVGDAAGQVKPTTGGGVYYGMLCADIAADTIHEALCADDFSAERLADYEQRWKRILAKEIQIGYLARRFYEKLSDSQIEHIFGIIQADRIHEDLLRSPDFSFDWHGDAILRVLGHRTMARTIWRMAKSLLPL
ncbi:MAG TPA: NAD(P)/FAD-dependent oxidoreductase [Dehalococcoidia bacterium]|nr:NAD(P)/FAD-dependent oxidoreductase [Dehalococcoidia bacterium]